MEKRIYRASILFATLACAAGAVEAQSSVTIYGTIDDGLLYQSRATTGTGSQFQIKTGGIHPSIWGFRGKEDLGGGMAATFNLEGHFSSNDGTMTVGPGFQSQIFRRQANVGLSTPYGTVTVGQQYAPALLAALATEPRGMKENFSNLYSWAYTQLSAPGDAVGAGSNAANDVGVFIANALQYSNTLGPVWLGAAYSFGGMAGTLKNGSEISLGATYAGPFTLSAAYQQTADSTSGAILSQLWSLGAAMPVGPVTVRFNYFGVIDRASSGPDISNVRALGAGLDYQWNPANLLTLAAYYDAYQGAHHSATKSLVLSNDYSLSKRTVVYAQLAYVDAGSAGSVDPLESLKTSIVAGGTAPGATTFLANVGIRHNF